MKEYLYQNSILIRLCRNLDMGIQSRKIKYCQIQSRGMFQFQEASTKTKSRHHPQKSQSMTTKIIKNKTIPLSREPKPNINSMEINYLKSPMKINLLLKGSSLEMGRLLKPPIMHLPLVNYQPINQIKFLIGAPKSI